MMLASSMNVVAMVFERILSGARQQASLIEQALALGAFPAQAIAPMRRQALRAAMIPTINGLLTVGLVQLPGMMTGQILSGTSPVQAVRYQLVIMYQLVAVASVSGALAAFLLQRVLFDASGRLLRWTSPFEKP
jgi:putative ABC transport system permease protein